MYFSRIRLNPQQLNISQWHKLAQDKKGNTYASHQLLWELFSHSQSRSFLFRHEIDKTNSNGLPIYYVLSEVNPQSDNKLFFVETKPYLPVLKSGQLLSFNLRANPVVAQKFRGRDTNSVRHDVLMHAKIEAKKNNLDSQELWPYMMQAAVNWLQKRSEKLGFSIAEEKIVVDCYQRHCFYKKSSDKPIKFSSVDYTGILQVEDRTLFEKTLFGGIGRAKAFGCGLILIRPQVN